MRDEEPEALTLDLALDPETSAARIGLVIMSVDEAGEDAFTSLMPRGTKVYTTRAAPDVEAFNQGRFELLGGFEYIGATLPPPGRLDLIAFGCTSGTIALGAETMARAFERLHPGVPCTNPAVAAVSGLRAASVDRVAILTPYPHAVHAKFPTYFADQGFTVVSHGTFDIVDDADTTRISSDCLLLACRRLMAAAGAEPDAVFISCMAIDVADRLALLTADLGVPVYSSAQLFAWHALTTLGLPTESTALTALTMEPA